MKVLLPLAALLLLISTVLSLDAIQADTLLDKQAGKQPDCKFHNEVYKYGATWPNNCAICRCREAGTVICGPDVSTAGWNFCGISVEFLWNFCGIFVEFYTWLGVGIR